MSAVAEKVIADFESLSASEKQAVAREDSASASTV
jgi:hypothetical protein